VLLWFSKRTPLGRRRRALSSREKLLEEEGVPVGYA
jgi:hypothetical protein